ncbi:MAG: hypothetical protein A2007_01530 [Verrucomicrobia bacterium GWC2_42_7]|nr:MAG: hypothetical protein A2007_01530 [Verrucomicrobia bacterium GWC2_42_7]
MLLILDSGDKGSDLVNLVVEVLHIGGGGGGGSIEAIDVGTDVAAPHVSFGIGYVGIIASFCYNSVGSWPENHLHLLIEEIGEICA